MPRGWRIVKAARATTAFDGEGARLYGGRWNSTGTAVVYASQSESLAVLELLVHLQSSQLLMSYCSIPVDFNDGLVEMVDPGVLPEDWSALPGPSALQEIGDNWAAEQRSVVLQIPSAIVPNEYNFVINPRHPDFAQVGIGPSTPIQLDPRLK